MVAKVLNIIGGFIVTVLGIRFVLMLLGANATNGFVNFIYDISRPLVSPFFGIFSYREQFGASRFEWATLVAIVVYALITWVLVMITSGGRRTT